MEREEKKKKAETSENAQTRRASSPAGIRQESGRPDRCLRTPGRKRD